jgi:putative redox protein
MTMECRVKWIDGGMSFVAETGSGHAFVMDGAPEAGGRNTGPRPMEAVLAGAGGCTAFDVVLIMKRSRQHVTGCEVKLSAERADTDPKVFTKLHMHFIVQGRDIKTSVLENALKLSHEKYCSATAMLGKTAAITYDYEIVQS